MFSDRFFSLVLFKLLEWPTSTCWYCQAKGLQELLAEARAATADLQVLCYTLCIFFYLYGYIYLHTWHSVTVAGKLQDDGCWTRRDKETAIAGPSWIMQKLESKDWKDNLKMDKWRSQQEFSLSSFEFYCIMNRLGCSWHSYCIISIPNLSAAWKGVASRAEITPEDPRVHPVSSETGQSLSFIDGSHALRRSPFRSSKRKRGM